jgi:anti-sigma regulatory factor (Ser/Thr protein kinase)
MELEATMANVGLARRFVRSELQGRVPEDAVSDLMLVTSELVTNAIEHGAPPVVLTVRTDEHAASVTVVSGGHGKPVPAVNTWRTANADQISGRGLGIVREIVDDIDVKHYGGTVEITALRRFEPQR